MRRREHIIDTGSDLRLADDEVFEPAEDSPYEDDFVALMRDLDKSQWGPNGELLDDFDHKFQFHQLHQEEQIQQAPHARITPPSVYRGILGGQATVDPVINAGQVIRVAYWQDDTEVLPVSVMFAPLVTGTTPPPSAAAPGNVTRAFVRLEFGSRGAVVTVDVDCGTGGQLTLPASSITLSVGLDSGSGAPFTLAAAIGFFPIVRTTVLTRTNYLQFVAAPITVNRPSFASGVYFDRADNTATNNINFLDGGANVLYLRTIAGATQYFNSPIPLSNDVAGIQATSDKATTARLIWTLNL